MGKATHEAGVRLVCDELSRRGFAINRYPENGDFTVAGKTVKVTACQDNGGGNCWSIDEDESEARKVANGEGDNEVHFRVFVKLDGDRKIVQSFVWDRDSDQDLIDKHGKKYGFYPYRQKALLKWQKRKGKAGWEWVKKALTR